MAELITVEADGGDFLHSSMGRPIHSARLSALSDNIVAALLHDDEAINRWPSCGHIVFCDTNALQAFAVVHMGIYYARAMTCLDYMRALKKGSAGARQFVQAFKDFALYPKTECVIAQLVGLAKCAGYGDIEADFMRLAQWGYSEEWEDDPVPYDPKYMAVANYLKASLLANREPGEKARAYGKVREPHGTTWDERHWRSGIKRIAVINAVTTAGKSTAIKEIGEQFNGDASDPEVVPVFDVLFANQLAYEGVDLQTRTCTIHHLDLPWEPGRYTQRNGRAVRQGALHKRVSIYAYLTDGTVDFYRLGRMEGRRAWLETVLKKDRASGLGGDTQEEQIDLIVSCTHPDYQEEVRKNLVESIALLELAKLQEKFYGIVATANAWTEAATSLAVNAGPFAGTGVPVPGFWRRTRLNELKATEADVGSTSDRAGNLQKLLAPAFWRAWLETTKLVLAFEGDALPATDGRGAPILITQQAGIGPQGTTGLLPYYDGGYYVTPIDPEDPTQGTTASWLGRVARAYGGSKRALYGSPFAADDGTIWGWRGHTLRTDEVEVPHWPATAGLRGVTPQSTVISNYDPFGLECGTGGPDQPPDPVLAPVDAIFALYTNGVFVRGNKFITQETLSRAGLPAPDLPISEDLLEKREARELTAISRIARGIGDMLVFEDLNMAPSAWWKRVANRMEILVSVASGTTLFLRGAFPYWWKGTGDKPRIVVLEQSRATNGVLWLGRSSYIEAPAWAQTLDQFHRTVARVLYLCGTSKAGLHPRRALSKTPPPGLSGAELSDWKRWIPTISVPLFNRLTWDTRGMSVWDADGNQHFIRTFADLFALPVALIEPPDAVLPKGESPLDLIEECPRLLLPTDEDWALFVMTLRDTPAVVGAGARTVDDVVREWFGPRFARYFEPARSLAWSDRAKKVAKVKAITHGSLFLVGDLIQGWVVRDPTDGRLWEVVKPPKVLKNGDVSLVFKGWPVRLTSPVQKFHANPRASYEYVSPYQQQLTLKGGSGKGTLLAKDLRDGQGVLYTNGALFEVSELEHILGGAVKFVMTNAETGAEFQYTLDPFQKTGWTSAIAGRDLRVGYSYTRPSWPEEKRVAGLGTRGDSLIEVTTLDGQHYAVDPAAFIDWRKVEGQGDLPGTRRHAVTGELIEDDLTAGEKAELTGGPVVPTAGEVPTASELDDLFAAT